MNITVSMGNMTDEPRIDVYEEHKKASFNLALNRVKGGADFPRFVAWDQRAEFVEKYCHKGMKLAIEGHIQTGLYEGKNGKVKTTDIIVDAIEFCEKKQKNETDGQPKENPTNSFINIPEGVDEEIPFT